MHFPLNTEDTVPKAAIPMLQNTQEAFGMVPNLERVMATAPALLESYGTLWALFNSTSFNAVERQIVYQAINAEHNCTY